MVQVGLVDSFDVYLELLRLLTKAPGHFYSVGLFIGCMVESTDFFLVTFELLAVLPLVTVRVVELLDGSVSLLTKKPVWAHGHIDVSLDVLTVLWRVVEVGRRPPEVPHVVGIDTVLRVMRLVPIGTPGALVLEHVESKGFDFVEYFRQVLVESWFVQEAINYVVVLLVLVLEPHI